MSRENILKTSAFKNMGNKRREILDEYLGKEKIEMRDAVSFVEAIRGEGELSQSEQRELMAAFISGLSDDEKKEVDRIISIIESFI